MSFRRSASEAVRGSVLDAIEAIGADALPQIEARLTDEQDAERRRQLWLSAQATGYTSPSLRRSLLEASSRDGLMQAEIRTFLAAAISLDIAGLQNLALEYLDSPDEHLSTLAVRYLSLFGDSTVSERLLKCFQAWSQQVNDSHHASWMCKNAIRGLLRLESDDDRRLITIRDVVVASLRGQGALATIDAVLLVDHLDWWVVWPALLNALADALPDPRQRNVVFHVLKMLDEVANPAALALLAAGARTLAAEGRDLSHLLSSAILARPPAVDEPLSDHTVRQAVRLIGLLRLDSAAETLGDLLERLDWPLDQVAADQLLVLGDSGADHRLARKLETWRTTRTGDLSDTGPLYAAATSAGPETIGWMDSFLRLATDEQVQIEFPAQVLLPLLQQGLLSGDQLANIALDPLATVSGRIASVFALAIYQPERYQDTFVALADESLGAAFDRYVVDALGRTSNPQVGGDIIRIASRRPEDDWLHADAAEGLAQLGCRDASDWVGQQFTRFADSRFISTLAQSWIALDSAAVSSVLTFLTDYVRGFPFQPSHYVSGIIDDLSEMWHVEAVREFVLSLVDRLHPGQPWLAEYQGDAFRSLVVKTPEQAIERAVALKAEGMLTEHSQEVLASNIGHLVQSKAGPERVVLLAAEMLATENRRVPYLMAEGFAAAPKLQSLTVLSEVMTDEREGVRSGAATCLAGLLGTSGELAVLSSDPSWRVRRAARQAVDDASHALALKDVVASIRGTGVLDSVHWRVLTLWANQHTLEQAWPLTQTYPRLAPMLYELQDVVEKRRRRELDDLRKSHGKYGPKGGSPQVISLG